MTQQATTSPNFVVVQAPPRVKGLPLIGSLLPFMQDPLPLVRDLQAQYGDIFALNLGLTKAVIVTSPDYAQHILRDNSAAYRKSGPIWEAVRSMVGNGLVTSEGDFWRRQRRMIQPHFNRQRIEALSDLMIEAIADELEKWTGSINQPFNVEEAAKGITMSVIVRTMFGADIAEAEVQDVSEAMNYAMRYLMTGLITESLPDSIPFPGKTRYQQALASINRVVSGLITRRRMEGAKDNDLLSIMIRQVDEETGQQMTDAQLQDEVMTIFLAGFETTATTIAWMLYLLSRHPRITTNVEAEVSQVLGNRAPTPEDITQLPYCRMVVQETMRTYPSAWMVSRMAAEDDEIDGYHITQGTLIFMVFHTIHHHPDHWEAPEQFMPERFNEIDVAKRHRFAWLPFGLGQRKCLGADFAMLEAISALAMITQRFHIEPHQAHTPYPKGQLTLGSKDGIYVTLQKRRRPLVKTENASSVQPALTAEGAGCPFHH